MTIQTRQNKRRRRNTPLNALNQVSTPRFPPASPRLPSTRAADLFKSPKLYHASLVKLVIAPLFTFAVLLLLRLVLPINDTIFITLFVVMAMPSAAALIMFVEMFGCDSNAAVKCILLSSMLSVITIPLLMLLSRFI